MADTPPPPPPRDPSRREGTELLERAQTERPRRFRVILFNDDYTTQEFVVMALMRFFHKDRTEATQLMLVAHTTGRALVGVYTRDIAESRVARIERLARDRGHPLMFGVEPDE